MGLAIDTVLAAVTMPTAAPASAAMTPATGDSFTVRSFAPTDRAILEQLITKAAHVMTLNVKSPMFHDNVEGIQVISAQTPGVHDLPQDIGQPLVPQDTLAVLGYLTDVAVAAVGIKGQETGNLRICGPATVLTQDTTDYFIRQALRSGRPHIPVFNSANAGSVYASCCDSAASTAVKVQLMLAEMSQNLSS